MVTAMGRDLHYARSTHVQLLWSCAAVQYETETTSDLWGQCYQHALFVKRHGKIQCDLWWDSNLTQIYQYSSMLLDNPGDRIRLSLFHSPNSIITEHSTAGRRCASSIVKRFWVALNHITQTTQSKDAKDVTATNTKLILWRLSGACSANRYSLIIGYRYNFNGNLTKPSFRLRHGWLMITSIKHQCN